MTINEAQEEFKRQSLILTGHKNVILKSDLYMIKSHHLTYRRIKTRSDWFIVRVRMVAHSSMQIDDIKIIKVTHSIIRPCTIKNVLDDYYRIINSVDQEKRWSVYSAALVKPLVEDEIIAILEETIFRQYTEDVYKCSLFLDTY